MFKQKLVEDDAIEVTHGCSATMDSKFVEKKNDLEAFTIPCTIRTHEFAKVLCDLSTSINLMSYLIYKKQVLDTPTPTSMQLLMEDRSIKRLVGILFDVLIKLDKFILPADYIALDCEMDHKVPIILGHYFLAIRRAVVDLEMGVMRFWVQKDKVSFKIYKSKKQTVELYVVSVVDVENKTMKD
ncbi:uncharacterized protein LOC107876550 [Capsicum annuum]|uniref:uncharacterized protein LOC107876550 n=1 Tax=Capsicum annuum TaxID=4072 RepID=UPI001FB12CB4|nr:uncharacterized protein LOC107876550 [Capsicum annuum]